MARVYEVFGAGNGEPHLVKQSLRNEDQHQSDQTTNGYSNTSLFAQSLHQLDMTKESDRDFVKHTIQTSECEVKICIIGQARMGKSLFYRFFADYPHYQEKEYTKRQTLDRKNSIDYILSQNRDLFPNKNVPIPYLRTEEPISEQEGIVEMMCDDFFQSLLFTVPGANIWNLKQRIAQKDWFMYVRTKRNGINEIKFKQMDQNIKTVSNRSGTPKERVKSTMTNCDEVGRFNSPLDFMISTEVILEMQRSTQYGKELMKVNGGLLKQNYRYLTNATKCQLCIDKNKAVNWCNTCGKNICSFCKLFHQKVWDVMNHDILPLREIY